MNIKSVSITQLIILTLFISSCGFKEKNENKPWNLTFRDGLLYKDSSATEPFTGHYKGKVMGKDIEYDVVDGKKHGLFVVYHENGNVETIGYIDNNNNHGEWKYYYPNGQLESVGKFTYDKPDSIWNWYYLTGTLMQEGKFIEGTKDGEWKFYDDFGNLRLLMKYKNDVLKDSIAYEIPEISDTLTKDSDSLSFPF